jgi:hypothetical protein
MLFRAENWLTEVERRHAVLRRAVTRASRQRIARARQFLVSLTHKRETLRIKVEKLRRAAERARGRAFREAESAHRRSVEATEALVRMLSGRGKE